MENREIKFRAWDKAKQVILTDPLCPTGHLNILLRNDSDVYVWMQYTGLKDVNDVEIYEGDIIKDKDYKDKKWIIEYRTDTEYVGFIPNQIGRERLSFFVSWNNFEIIGNIYENPELLTTKTIT